MKKKILFVVLSISIMSVISGCGKKNDTAEDTTTQAQTESEAEEKEKVHIETAEYVTLPDYTNMEVTVSPEVVSDDDILDYINTSILTSYPITDRAVEEGDIANIDYVGKKDGVAFDGGSAEGYDLEIGSHKFIDGFEDGLIGVMPGDTVDLNLTFPEEYGNADLAGQDVVFTVTVHGIMETTDYDNVTDEQIEAMGLNYDSKEAIWEDAKIYCEQQKSAQHETDIENAIFEKLLAETEFSEIPQALIDEKVDTYNEYMDMVCQQYYGCDLETYITTYAQKSMDEYNEELNQMSTEAVKQDMIFDAIAKAENMEITDDELNSSAAEDAAGYGYDSAEELLADADVEVYRENLLQQKVMDFLVKNVTVIEDENAITEDSTQDADIEEETTQQAAE